MALPKGKYFVFIQAGGLFGEEAAKVFDRHSYKTSNFSQGTGKIPYRNDFDVKGLPLGDTDDTFEEFGTVYDYVSHEVTVSDGRLTIKAGPTAKDARIRQIIITQIRAARAITVTSDVCRMSEVIAQLRSSEACATAR
jgi:hypothetical protein